VQKTLTGVLVLAPDHKLVQYKIGNLDQLLHRAKSVCDQCRDCTDLCPRFLLGHKMEPHLLMTAIGWGNELGQAALETAHLCCECGICGIYACPMDLHPNLYIHRIKEELNAAGIHRTKGSAPAQPRESYSMRKLPYARLKTRLGLGRYTDNAPLAAEPLQVDEVKLLLHQHVGAPCEAVVKEGQKVKEGDPVGEVPAGALGARVHASISGKVKEVNERWVIIQSR
jgi:Na+-translocating ferredoxin:NAD+ oxidoreductase RnfC subunit